MLCNYFDEDFLWPLTLRRSISIRRDFAFGASRRFVPEGKTVRYEIGGLSRASFTAQEASRNNYFNRNREPRLTHDESSLDTLIHSLRPSTTLHERSRGETVTQYNSLKIHSLLLCLAHISLGQVGQHP